MAKETVEIHKKGRPVLVGTTSVEKSELLSALLAEQSIPHNLLNAKPENVEREAEIVAQAGRYGAVTIATNMAGRGTDIILGGNSDYIARLKVKEILSSRLIRPEEGHKMPITTQRNSQSVGFKDNNDSNVTSKKYYQSLPLKNLFPGLLTEETDNKLASLASKLVKEWGDRTLSSI